jgi:hypothetical protein
MNKFLDIASRIDHLSQTADWIARETVHTDNCLSQAATLVNVLSEDIRERMLCLLQEMESLIESRGYQ